MDGDRFDGWLRASSQVGSRRRMLAGFAAIVASAAVGAASGQDAGAAAIARKKGTRDVCHGKRDGATCENNGQCLKGKCKHRPNCDSAGAVCGEGQLDCCSGRCAIVLGQSTGACLAGGAGARCRVNDDCQSGHCIGFVCQA